MSCATAPISMARLLTFVPSESDLTLKDALPGLPAGLTMRTMRPWATGLRRNASSREVLYARDMIGLGVERLVRTRAVGRGRGMRWLDRARRHVGAWVDLKSPTDDDCPSHQRDRHHHPSHNKHTLRARRRLLVRSLQGGYRHRSHHRGYRDT